MREGRERERGERVRIWGEKERREIECVGRKRREIVGGGEGKEQIGSERGDRVVGRG